LKLETLRTKRITKKLVGVVGGLFPLLKLKKGFNCL